MRRETPWLFNEATDEKGVKGKMLKWLQTLGLARPQHEGSHLWHFTSQAKTQLTLSQDLEYKCNALTPREGTDIEDMNAFELIFLIERESGQ